MRGGVKLSAALSLARVAITLGVTIVAGAAPAARAVAPADPCRLTLRDPSRMLDRQVSPALLARAFAPKELREAAVEIGEGETLPGTVVFPDDPRRRLSVVWRERPSPAGRIWLMVDGESRWRGHRDIGLGTELRTLERLNGRPFTLAGFAWDYGGTVVDWRGGALASIATERCRLIVRLEPPRSAPRHLVDQVIDDRDFPSDHPAMRALNPAAYQVILELP
jgi:hypothetical protein